MSHLLPPFRLGVFYDGTFFLHASNYYNYFHDQRSRLSINGLHAYIIKRVAEEMDIRSENCFIAESHYYRGRINAVEASQRGNQLYNDRVFEDIMMAEGVHTHYLPLRNTGGRKEEGGIDVLLSLDALEMVMADRIDAVVLIASDTNYVPLVRKIHSLGIRTVLLSWHFDYMNEDNLKVVTRTSNELIQLSTFSLLMHEEIDDGILHEDQAVIDLFVERSETRSKDCTQDLSEEREDSDMVYLSEVMMLKGFFGFIKYPNNNLYFSQYDLVNCEFDDLMIGDSVEFTIGVNNKGEEVAKEVKKVFQPPI